MHRIEIENFGPVRAAKVDVRDFLVFIGPQASGKSTVAKNIYFFRSLREELMRQVYYAVQTGDAQAVNLRWFKGRIINRFVGFWGTTGHLDPFKIVYRFSESKSIVLSLHRRRVQPEMSNPFQTKLEEIFYQISQFLSRATPRNGYSEKGILASEAERDAFRARMDGLVDALFEDDRMSLFIPAGRSLLSTLSGPLQTNLFTNIDRQPGERDAKVDPYLLDDTLRAFISRINRTKGEFSQPFETIIARADSFEPIGKDHKALFSQAIQMIDHILRGRYRMERDAEKIQLLDSDKYVKLSFASSGQQEVVWMLLQLFSLMVNRQKTFLSIEEPEAHLFPDAQRQIVELLCLFGNMPGNQVTVTTHSPYILSALNNFMYAGKLGQSKAEAVNRILPASTWMRPERVGAYFVESGEVRSIIDPELELIKVEEIDRVSSEINAQFNDLFLLDEL